MENLIDLARKTFYSFFAKRTWRKLEYFDPSWSKRIAEMAKYIAPSASVLDLGCGKMWTKNYLSDSKYYPVDYRDRGKGTIVCDFNKGEFPDIFADVAFVSGTLEYVNDDAFIDSIAKHCNQCVISYCLLEDHPQLAFRRRQAWVNDFSRDEILNMIWSEHEYPTPRTIDNFILRLRKWVELDLSAPTIIRSVRGVGYLLERESS